ncbi:MAG: class IV adenylate cyclase [Planctomycetota bacterium]|jgi:adenylate cyclase class 2
MHTEIEAKLKVESLNRPAKRLEELGATFVAEQIQIDYYFDDAERTLTKSDRCLRLRRVTGGRADRTFLTYKGPKERHELKKREEIEIEVGDRDSMEKLLSALGYKEVLTFEKKRRIWQVGECEVGLDELALLGSFVEIEGPDADKITKVQESLGLEHLPHIPHSYALLVAHKLSQQSYQ